MRFLILLALALFPSISWAVTVNSAHPRFLRAADVATIRAECQPGGVNYDMGQELLKPFADSYVNGSDGSRCHGVAVYWYFYEPTSDFYRDNAIRLLKLYLTAGNTERPGGHAEGGFYSQISRIAVTFDLLYNELVTLGETQLIADVAARLDDALASNLCGDTAGEAWKCRTNQLSWLLAAYGHSTQDAAILTRINLIADFYDNVSCPCSDIVNPYGMWDQYDGTSLANWVVNYSLLKTGTNYTGAMDTASIPNNAWKYLLTKIRPEPYTVAEASETRTLFAQDYPPGKALPDDNNALPLLCFFGWQAPTPSLYARDLAVYMRSNMYGHRRWHDDSSLFFTLAWGRDSAGTDWTEAPLEVFDDARAWYSGVQAHQIGNSATRIKFIYYGGLNSIHEGPSGGHYQISRGPYNGDWRSGYRHADFNNAFGGLLSKTDALNTLRIYKSGEAVPSASRTWSSHQEGGTGATCATNADTFVVIDRGFQNNESSARNQYPECIYNSPDDTYAENWLEKRGDLFGYVSDDEFMRVAHTLTDAYGGSASKQTGTYRSATWVKLPNNIGQGFFLFWSRADLNAGVTKFQDIVHMPNRPQFDGAITVTRGGGIATADSIPVDWDGPLGNTALDTHGGIYRSTNSTRAYYDDGNARFAAYLLHASDGSGTAPQVVVTGGPNRLHQYGKQSWLKYYFTFATPAQGGTSYEAFYHGKNFLPGAYADPTCAGLITAWDGTQVRPWRQYMEKPTDIDFTKWNNRPFPYGRGADACRWRYEYGWDNLSIATGPRRVDVIRAVYAGPNTIARDDLPDVYGVMSGDVYAFGYQPNGGSYSAIVVPSPDTSARLTSVTYTNPLYGHALSGSQTHRITMLEPDRQWAVTGVSGSTASDANGTLVVSIPAGTETIEVTGGNTPAPVPDPDPGSTFTLVNDQGYHPRGRQLLRAAGGTMLALSWSEGAYGTDLWGQISRDDGQTWRDFDGALDSYTQLLEDIEPFSLRYVAPRLDTGFGAAISPANNELVICYGQQVLNSSHAVTGAMPRLRIFDWDDALQTWESSPSYSLDGTEVSGTANDRIAADCVVAVAKSGRAYAAWRAPDDAGYSVYSVRVKSGAAATMAQVDSLASPHQYPQIVEQPSGTVWLISAVRVSSTEDSVRVRTATDGTSAQWGATSHVPGIYTGGNGEFSACRGPSGPFVAIRRVPGGDDLLSYAYWDGSAWQTGDTAALDHTISHLAATPAGVGRVVVTTRDTSGANPAIERAYWSLTNGWSPWETIWPATAGLAYPHVAAMSSTSLCVWAWRTAGVDGFEARTFSIPGPVEPTGACCVSTTCTITTAADCAGTWQGADTACSPNPCVAPPASGACCYPTGTCAVTTEDGCGGEYQGDGTDCDPNPCPAGPPSQSGRRRRVLLAGG